ncbi:MAG: hypothetical protein WAU31_00450 [Candidatus Moraniibacteriota bacterium]
MMDHRRQKKVVFGAIYGVLFLCLAYLVYLPFKPPETCLDGKKNQNETGIDCGGVCGACVVEPVLEDIQVTESAWVLAGKGNEYDVVGKISNPNNDYGASSVAYTFRVLDASGGVLTEKSGTSFILPKEEKYLVETGLALSGKPSRVDVVLKEVAWEKFAGYKERPALDVYNRNFERASGTSFGVAKGLVVNNSPFDFTSIGIVVVLRDGNSHVVALQKTDMQTLRSGEQRDFTLLWPDPFQGDVEKVEVQTDANVYRTDTFIRTYLPTMSQSFQNLNR